MDKEEVKELALEKSYDAAIAEQIKIAQESGDIPELFVYSHNGRKWMLTLPHSVMAQKRLINLSSQHMAFPADFDKEEAFIRAVAQNTKVDGREVVLDQLSLGELEVLKISYRDGLLLPLFLGGDKEVQAYMKAAIEHLK